MLLYNLLEVRFQATGFQQFLGFGVISTGPVVVLIGLDQRFQVVIFLHQLLVLLGIPGHLGLLKEMVDLGEAAFHPVQFFKHKTVSPLYGLWLSCQST